MESLFSSFVDLIRDLAEADLAAEIAYPRRLLVESGHHGQKSLDIAYAPFDHVNRQAEIVIVGLTPGDRKSVVQGKGVSVCVDHGGRGSLKKKTNVEIQNERGSL